MRRREFIGLVGGAGAWPVLARAQQTGKIPVVGFLWGGSAETTAAKERVAALRKGLQEEGFIEGTNYSLAVRFAEGDINRIPQLARELGALNARVIVAVGSLYGMAEFRRAFPELPLVFTSIAADLVALGAVRSYAHPGGMITGNVMNVVGGEETMAQKRIGLFKQLVPSLTRLGLIAPAKGVLAMQEKEALQKVAAQLDFEFVQYDLNAIDDLENAFAAGLRDDVSAFYISTEPLLFTNLSRVVSSVTASRKPSVGTIADWDAPGF